MIKDICVNLCTPLEECIDGIVCTRGVKVNVASPSIIVENMQATITCDTTGVTIKYTLDGSTPSATNGTTYSSAINLTQNCTIKAIAIKGNNVSAVVEYIYTMPIVNTPVITITDNSVTISCDTTGAIIYYTLDGSTPTTLSTVYTSAIALTQSCTIKAIAVKSGMTNSGIAEEEYVKPITYLTQWRMMGNSVVHTDEYLTQWKVEGNSVVDNNAILSCGDLGQDGKYHVKISNGVSIYDIPLTEPLRKVNDVADSIEFANGVATLTRNIASTAMSALNWNKAVYRNTGKYRYVVYSLRDIIKTSKNDNTPGDILCTIYNTTTANGAYATKLEGIAVDSTYGSIYLYDANYDQEGDLNAFLEHIQGAEMVYALATPTTETIQVSPFPISPTDTYTSANDTPYSAFEYKKNVEIWSCGEYNATDGKYHILVQPLGGNIVDIALDEPLRKVNDVADSIEFANGVATLTRNFDSIIVSNLTFSQARTSIENIYRYRAKLGRSNFIAPPDANTPFVGLCALYNVIRGYDTYSGSKNGIASTSVATQDTLIYIYDSNYNGSDDLAALVQHISGMELIYQCTPTTEIIQVPQIAEADSYTCVISQGGKAVSWSNFETE